MVLCILFLNFLLLSELFLHSQVYSYSLWLIFDTAMFDAFLDYAVTPCLNAILRTEALSS